jgi:hypothetical protein
MSRRDFLAAGQFAFFWSAAVPAAADGSGKAFKISDIRLEFLRAAGEDTRAPVKLAHRRLFLLSNHFKLRGNAGSAYSVDSVSNCPQV